jgi:hypothetical protein
MYKCQGPPGPIKEKDKNVRKSTNKLAKTKEQHQEKKETKEIRA